MSGRCETCRFWNRADLTSDDNKSWPAGDQPGLCQRYPPRMYVNTEAEPDNADSVNWMHNWHFPVTVGHEWCGEFKPKESP